jgi:hypothetical protein
MPLVTPVALGSCNPGIAPQGYLLPADRNPGASSYLKAAGQVSADPSRLSAASLVTPAAIRAAAHIYMVRTSDTLGDMADRIGAGARASAQVNRIPSPYRLRTMPMTSSHPCAGLVRDRILQIATARSMPLKRARTGARQGLC